MVNDYDIEVDNVYNNEWNKYGEEFIYSIKNM